MIVRRRDQQAVRAPEVEHEHDQPARQQRDADEARQRRARLVRRLAEHRADEATLSTPDAATIMKIANTCGRPQTTWLSIPVTTWPCSSMEWAAPRARPARPARRARGSAQNRRGAVRVNSVCGHRASEPLVANAGVEPQVGAQRRWRRTRRRAARSRSAGSLRFAEQQRLVTRGGARLDAGREPIAIDPVDAQRARLHAALAARHVGFWSMTGSCTNERALYGQAIMQ